jgi:hypothetical protein
MTPPPDFTAAVAFTGFQNTTLGASIMVAEMPGDYMKIIKNFTAENLKKSGMEMLEMKLMPFNGSKAAMVKVRQAAGGVTYLKDILIFGDSNNTVMINGIYPEATKSIAGDIQRAILSTRFDPSQKTDPLNAVPFTIDVTGTDFKLAQSVSGSLLYTTDGKVPSETPALVVGKSIAKVPPEIQERYARERIKKYPRGEQTVITEINPVSVDNMKGFEIVGAGKSKDNTPALVYQLMVFDETGDYYMVVGQCKDTLTDYLNVYKSIARSFKRK